MNSQICKARNASNISHEFHNDRYLDSFSVLSTAHEEDKNTKLQVAQLCVSAGKRETVLSNLLVWLLGLFEFVWVCFLRLAVAWLVDFFFSHKQQSETNSIKVIQTEAEDNAKYNDLLCMNQISIHNTWILFSSTSLFFPWVLSYQRFTLKCPGKWSFAF